MTWVYWLGDLGAVFLAVMFLITSLPIIILAWRDK